VGTYVHRLRGVRGDGGGDDRDDVYVISVTQNRILQILLHLLTQCITIVYYRLPFIFIYIRKY
jgi:hypothetical protein